MDNRGRHGRIAAMIRQLILWFPLLLPTYLLRIQLGSFPTTVLELALVATIGLASLSCGWKVWREGWSKTRAWHGPVALWILATVMAIVVAPNQLAALGLWRAYVLEPILFALLLAGTVRDEKDRRDVMLALVASVMFVAGWAVLQYLGLLQIPPPWDTDFLTRRATGPFPFPNAVALFCAPIAALCIGILLHPSSIHFNPHLAKGELRGSKWLVILLVGFFSGTLATLLAKSVGGFLAILVATLVALIWNRRTRRATCVISIVIAITIVLIPKLRTPIVSTLSFQAWSGQVRLITWRETWAMLKDTSTPLGTGRPIFGAGFGAYRDVIVPYHRATAIEIFQYPHNLFLNIWSETGLLGIVAFGWMCVTFVRQSKVKEVSPATLDFQTFRLWTLLPLIAILIHSLVDVPYFKNDLAFIFWILAVLTIRSPAPLPV